jgi:hypothetical protein
MRQAGAVMVAGRGQENLGLMLQAPEGFRMDYPVPVSLENRPQIAAPGLLSQSSPGLGTPAGIRRKEFFFLFFKLYSDICAHDQRYRPINIQLSDLPFLAAENLPDKDFLPVPPRLPAKLFLMEWRMQDKLAKTRILTGR